MPTLLQGSVSYFYSFANDLTASGHLQGPPLAGFLRGSGPEVDQSVEAEVVHPPQGHGYVDFHANVVVSRLQLVSK